MIDGDRFKYNFCFSSTQSLMADVKQGNIFKYNFCFSSTINKLNVTKDVEYLNTTFVSLQLS